MVSHMKIEARWLSQQGTRTADNRDHAGLGARPGEFLGIVVDGSTPEQPMETTLGQLSK